MSVYSLAVHVYYIEQLGAQSLFVYGLTAHQHSLGQSFGAFTR